MHIFLIRGEILLPKKNTLPDSCAKPFLVLCRDINSWKNIHLWSEERRERRKRVERGAAKRESVTENVEKMKKKEKEKLIVFA